MKTKREKRVGRFKKAIIGTAIACGIGSTNGFSVRADEITSLPNTVRTSIENGDVVSTEEFSILDMGNHKYTNFERIGFRFIENKKKNIPTGIVISSVAEDLCDINNDVQYVKQIMEEYDVEHAVYLNVNDIITNDKIDDETKAKIVRDFVENCSNNGIYVGLYGSDSNLCYLKGMAEGIFDIYEYDAFVVMDGPYICYRGPFNTYMDYNGEVHSEFNIPELIKENGLNKTENFINDAKHVITAEDTKESISELYDMPIEDLMKYTGLTMDYFKPGVTLRISRKYIIENRETKYESTSANRYAKELGLFVGVDVSSYQDNIDWDLLKENVDFVIAKCNQGTEYLDDMFDEYAIGCSKNDIAFGAYCFNNYWGDLEYNEFVQKQKAQVTMTIDCLKNKKIEAPVYFDIEGALCESKIPKEYVQAMLDIWYTEITKAGYTPGIYSGQCDMNYLYDCVGSEVFDKFDIWVAGGYHYDDQLNIYYAKPSYNDLDYLYNSIKERVNVVQISQYGLGIGASNDEGFVDLNFAKKSFKSYKIKTFKELEQGDFITKHFYSSKSVEVSAVKSMMISGVGVMVGLELAKKRKVKELSNVIENSGN